MDVMLDPAALSHRLVLLERLQIGLLGEPLCGSRIAFGREIVEDQRIDITVEPTLAMQFKDKIATKQATISRRNSLVIVLSFPHSKFLGEIPN